MGSTIHGLVSCHDVLGGPTMNLPEEITHGDYPALLEMLIAAGGTLPSRTGGNDAVQGLLRRHGVADAE